MEIPLLNEITVIFALSIVVVFLCNRLRVPAIVGFLITGVLAGPHGFGLVKALHEVNMMAEIGVVLLVFTTGIEFSFRKLLTLKKPAIVGGLLQTALTAVAIGLLVKMTGQPLGLSIFVGLLVCHTSTAIMLKLLQTRDELNSPHGGASLAISLFQDISSVPMMLMIPLLAGAGGSQSWWVALLQLAGKGMLIIALMYVSAVWIVPKLLYHVARTRSYELFLLTIVAICFAVTWLTSSIGLSLALGAFFAGLVISESEYSYQALSNILPFRDVFSSFFFISVGMLLDFRFVVAHPLLVTSLTFGILLIKAILAGAAILIIGYPLRTAILAGILLCQIGEFSFILAQAGMSYGLLTPHIYQLFLAVVVVTMVTAPFLMMFSPWLVEKAMKLPIARHLKKMRVTEKISRNAPSHLIIVGFGLNGRNLARVARMLAIPYVILELNAETVKNEKAKGEPIHYGDATQEAILKSIGIEEARMIVVGVSDPVATRMIIQVARRLSAKIHIIARIRFYQEMKLLYDLGANEVIPEELEASMEIFTRVLRKYLIPRDEIEKFVTEIRADNYEMLRTHNQKEAKHFAEVQPYLANLEISTLRLAATSSFCGKSLAEINLRKKFGVTVLAIQRGAQIHSGPDGETQLLGNDIVIMMGSPGHLTSVTSLFQNPVQWKI